MPYKNDNLEELFQKAAKDYPLKTDDTNWGKVAANLKTPATEAIAVRNNKFFKYAAFVILLLGGSMLLYKSQVNSVKLTHQQKSKIILNNQTKQNSTPSLSITENNNSKTPTPTLRNKTDFTFKSLSISGINNNATKLKAGNSIAGNTIISDNTKPSSTINNQNIAIESTQQLNQNTDVSIENKVSTDQINKGLNNSDNIEKGSVSSSVKGLVKYQQPSSKFYGTLYGSPEFSMVKFQHLVKPGYQVGVALGYRINSQFDVEIGLKREHINYYTAGKYFDKSGLKLKDPVSLESVSGRSKLTSVPVTLKYNFSSRHSSHFYVASAINALVLTHTESYNYTISKNGEVIDRSKNYSSVTNPKYFTGINFSGGYETKLSNWCNIKIEPYYQIPIGNVGVGKLPVTSFGVNIGIVKDLK